MVMTMIITIIIIIMMLIESKKGMVVMIRLCMLYFFYVSYKYTYILTYMQKYLFLCTKTLKIVATPPPTLSSVKFSITIHLIHPHMYISKCFISKLKKKYKIYFISFKIVDTFILKHFNKNIKLEFNFYKFLSINSLFCTMSIYFYIQSSLPLTHQSHHHQPASHH